MKQRGASLFVILGIIVADASSKEAALSLLDGRVVPVLPVLNFTLAFNRGVSFSLFSTEGLWGWWALVLLTVAISTAVGWLWYRAPAPLERLGYALILGGALGNLVDRLPDAAVTDFIDLHAAGWHFPTFNLADVSITTGVLFLVLSSFLDPRLHRA